MTAPLDSKGNPYITDRRRDRRQRVLFSSVVMSASNCGRILDISPKGLALQTDSALVGDGFPNFLFKFSPTLAWVGAKGQVVWRNNSKNVVGIEFIGLTDEVHNQIQTWMDSKKELSGIGAVILGPAPAPATFSASATGVLVSPASKSVDRSAENRSPAPVLPPVAYTTEMHDARTTAKSAVAENIAGGTNKVLWLVGLALVATLLVTSALLQRLHLRKLSNSQRSTEMARAPHSPVAPLQPAPPAQEVSPAQPVPSAERPSVPSPNRRSSLNGPAFVVQVGAMIHRENANALAASLREMNFPAFVIKLPTERFNHVLVGPYNRVDATIEVQKELEKRGFQTIRSKWRVSSP
jgi:cell division septation protein DedD